MVFLTGDVHNMSLDVPHQRLLRATELIAADRYAAIAEEHGLKVTLFVSGRAAVEEPDAFERLMRRGNVEIGGHTWDSFMHRRLHRAFELLYGSPVGPRGFQCRRIGLTVEAIRRVTDAPVLCWRGHGYAQDRHTHRLLRQHGIRFVSNEVGPGARIESPKDGLVSVPINVMPDHEYVYHGEITPERRQRQLLYRQRLEAARANGIRFLAERETGMIEAARILLKDKLKTLLRSHRFESDLPFGDVRLTPAEWLSRLEETIPQRICGSGFATVLAHPLCMEIFDDMATFRKLCALLKNYATEFVSQASRVRMRVS